MHGQIKPLAGVNEHLSIGVAPGSIAVEWAGSVADVPPAVWLQCFPPPLEGRWWYLALERSGIEDQFEFSYAVMRRDNAIIAVAPVFRMDLAVDIMVPDAIAPLVRACNRVMPFLRFQRTWFVGSPCSEEGTIGLMPGVTLAEVLPALDSALEARAKDSRAHMIVWKDVPEGAASTLRAFAKRTRLFEVPSFPGTEIRAPGGSFDAYLKTLTSKRRYALKKKLAASRAELDLACEVVRRPDAATHAEIWRLFSKTYEKATTRFERLTPAFFQAIAEGEGVSFLLLRERTSKRLVAFMLCFYQRDRAINKFIGIDYDAGKQAFLYFRLWEEFVRWAISQGAVELQSGQTSYSAKLDLGHELVPLCNFSRHRFWLLHVIYAFVGRFITWSTLDEDLKTHVAAKSRKDDEAKSRKSD